MGPILPFWCPQSSQSLRPPQEFADPWVWATEDAYGEPDALMRLRAPPGPPTPTSPPLVPYTAWTAADAYWWLTLVRANSYVHNDSFIVPAIAARGPIEVYKYVNNQDTGLTPNYWWGKMPDRFCVGINGTSSDWQSINYVLSHQMGLQVRTVRGDYFNATFLAAAAPIADAVMPDYVAAGSPPLCVIGHSLGGACAMILYTLLRTGAAMANDRIVTVGGPRTACSQSAPRFIVPQVIRFCNVGDTVVDLPPPREIISIVYPQGVGTAYLGGEYTHIGSAQVMMDNRGAYVLPDPTWGPLEWLVRMYGWIGTGFELQPHFAMSYAGLAEAWASNGTPVNVGEYANFTSLYTINANLAAAGV